ncbi:hypothetical protein H4R18_002810 [Coemansia javaensis]|uniref:DH domain-containing protein n=1 Tax=Coemansia javaensis TaxID=2761396 RepID=A0A9W8HC19_9FUNG|nr:hypothetical protein H4R18_002810 [Coemansia javaensis]
MRGADAAIGLLEAIAMDPAAEHARPAQATATSHTHDGAPRMRARHAPPPDRPPRPGDAADACLGGQDSADTSDEELYLRHASVLYHELWSSDWVDRLLAGPALQDEEKEAAEPGARHVGAAGSATTTDSPSAAAAAASADGTDGSCAGSDAGPAAATAGSNITTAERAPRTMAGTIAQPDNGRASSTAAHDGCSAVVVVAPASPLGSPAGARVAHGFSPADLADALVGTVRRLEDDHTLRQHKRWSVVKELSVTEAHYLQDLLLLRAVFCEPLAATLRPDDVRLIFGNLDQVIDCARSLVEYLTVAVVYEATRCVVLGDEGLQSSSSSGADIGADGGVGVGAGAAAGARPTSQPAVMRTGSSSSSSDPRNSARADISVAQAFLLMSQRMEHAYARYCQGFEAASQRIIELKRLAAATGAATAPGTPTTAPPTPAPTPTTADGLPPPPGSPAADHVRGWPGDAGDLQPDPGGPDAAYAAVAHQHITQQAQCLAGKTTSWDLASLLIKPVQRILKYPLLIRSLLGLTHTHTLDRSRLEKAAQGVERIAEAINAVHQSGGLRISTATAGSSVLAAGDDGQGRVARELRRVLRRRPGNTTLPRARSQAESFMKERLRMPAKAKARELLDRPLPPVPPPPSGAAALLEQHENRIAGLGRALRAWEASVDAVLRQQCAVAARWRDLYAGADEALADGPAPWTPRPQSDAWADDAPASDPDPARTRRGDQRSPRLGLGDQRSPQLGLGDQCSPRLELGDLDSDLRHQWQLAAELSRQTRSAHRHGRDRTCSATDEPWAALKRARAAEYCAALDAVRGTLYPSLVCAPLRSRVYPVLDALLQAYRDGPRHILREAARTPGAAPDGGRLSALQDALADELPRLFDHERTVLRLLVAQVAGIQHRFHSQAVALLSAACAASGLAQEPGTPPTTAPARAVPLPALDQRPASAAQLLRPSRHAASPGAPSHIEASYSRRVSERAVSTPGTLLPSAAECTSQIQSGLWRLAQELQRSSPAQELQRSSPAQEPRRSGPAQYASRARLHDSLAADASDAASDHSAAADSCLAAPALEITAPWESPAPPRHARKRSVGLMDRLAGFRTGRAARTLQAVPMASRLDDGSLDGIKPRPHTRSGPGTPAEAPPPLPPKDDPARARSRSTHRARSEVDIRAAAAAAAGWTISAAKYEPLPLVDPIRFSKGFVDATFRMFDAQDRAGGEQPGLGADAAPGAGGRCK